MDPPGTGIVCAYDACTAASAPSASSTACARSHSKVMGTRASVSAFESKANARRSTSRYSSLRLSGTSTRRYPSGSGVMSPSCAIGAPAAPHFPRAGHLRMLPTCGYARHVVGTRWAPAQGAVHPRHARAAAVERPLAGVPHGRAPAGHRARRRSASRSSPSGSRPPPSSSSGRRGLPAAAAQPRGARGRGAGVHLGPVVVGDGLDDPGDPRGHHRLRRGDHRVRARAAAARAAGRARRPHARRPAGPAGRARPGAPAARGLAGGQRDPLGARRRLLRGLHGGGHAVRDGALEIVLVDVSGKGLDAGVRSLQLSGAFGGLLGAMPRDEFLRAANGYLLAQAWDEGFATAIHVAVDLRTGDFWVSSAGHPPAVQLHAGSGRLELLDTVGSPALGVVPDIRCDVPGRTAGARRRPPALHGRAGRGARGRPRPGHRPLHGGGRPRAGAGSRHCGGGARRGKAGDDDDRAVVLVHRD